MTQFVSAQHPKPPQLQSLKATLPFGTAELDSHRQDRQNPDSHFTFQPQTLAATNLAQPFFPKPDRLPLRYPRSNARPP